MSEVVKHWPGVSVNSTFVYAHFVSVGLKFLAKTEDGVTYAGAPIGIPQSLDKSATYIYSLGAYVKTPELSLSASVVNVTADDKVSADACLFSNTSLNRYWYGKDYNGREVLASEVFYTGTYRLGKDGVSYVSNSTPEETFIIAGDEYKQPSAYLSSFALEFNKDNVPTLHSVETVSSLVRYSTTEWIKGEPKSTKLWETKEADVRAEIARKFEEAAKKEVIGIDTFREEAELMPMYKGTVDPVDREYLYAIAMGNITGVLHTSATVVSFDIAPIAQYRTVQSYTPGEWSTSFTQEAPDFLVYQAIKRGDTIEKATVSLYTEASGTSDSGSDRYVNNLHMETVLTGVLNLWDGVSATFGFSGTVNRAGATDLVRYQFRNRTGRILHLDLLAKACVILVLVTEDDQSIEDFEREYPANRYMYRAGLRQQVEHYTIEIYHGEYTFSYPLARNMTEYSPANAMIHWFGYPSIWVSFLNLDSVASGADLPIVKEGDDFGAIPPIFMVSDPSVLVLGIKCFAWADDGSVLYIDNVTNSAEVDHVSHFSIYPPSLRDEVEAALGVPLSSVKDVKYLVATG